MLPDRPFACVFRNAASHAALPYHAGCLPFGWRLRGWRVADPDACEGVRQHWAWLHHKRWAPKSGQFFEE